MEKRWYLSAVDIIDELPEGERTFFYQKSHKKKYSKNSIIFSPGDQGNLIYYVLSGRVKIYNLSECGKEIIYWFCQPEDFFGLAEVCGGEMRTVFAEAVEDTEILCINRTNFEELISRNPKISIFIMRILGSRIRQAHETIKDLIVCDVHTRLAQLLINLGQVCGSNHDGVITIEKKFTHQEMANMIGATRTTVTEVMNEFKKDGYIKCDGSKVTILDYARLVKLIESSD
ncbi:MAG: Crp/Fnr family transcriptional regulator [Nitrospiraceae bacterium]|nr:Crp/Fnr family transcriptional regulator [Nitrospiraceae bacterium]